MAIAEHREGAEVPKRTRKGASKSRNGCLTCKARRIRCDEERPACRRCSDTSRTCDFLLPIPQVTTPCRTAISIRRQKKERQARLQELPNTILLKPSPSLLKSFQGSRQDLSNFDYFRTICAQSFQGYFENTLWSRTVLQISQIEPSIRCAVIALASLHRSRFCNEPRSNSPTITYLAAMNTLNQRLDGSAVSHEIALFGCLLFSMFELLNGNDEALAKHFMSGLAIATNYQTRFSKTSDNMQELMSAFSRLDLQATFFLPGYCPSPLRAPTTPVHFKDLSHARESLNDIIISIQNLIKPCSRRCSTLPYDPLPLDLSNSLNTHTQLLTTWQATYSILTSSTRKSHNDIAQQTSRNVLYIQYLAAKIHLCTFFYQDKLAYDVYISDFRSIVSLSEQVLCSSIQNPLPNSRFSSDIGVIQPLFLTACQCRHPIVRRAAISLLMKSGREGIWDGETMGAVAQWVMEQEEAGIPSPAPGETLFIPEDRRLREIGLAGIPCVFVPEEIFPPNQERSRAIELGVYREEKTVRIASIRMKSNKEFELLEGTAVYGQQRGVEGDDIERRGKNLDEGLDYWVSWWEKTVMRIEYGYDIEPKL